MIDLDELDNDGRKRLAATLCGQLSSAQSAANSDDIALDRILTDSAQYSISTQPLPKNAYSEYRDKTVQRASRVRTSLLTANEPRPSVLPQGYGDAMLARVIRQLDDYYWETKRIGLKYALMTGSMVDYGTAGLMPDMVRKDGKWDIDVLVVPLRSIILGDWTQWDVSEQPFFARIVPMSIRKAKARFEEFAAQILPESSAGNLGGFDKIWDDYWSASGSSAVKNPMRSKDQAKADYLSGNVMVYEYWTKDDDGKIIRAYIINNVVMEYEETDYPDYPLCLFRNYMRENSALGLSETQIARDVTDARTEIMQMILLQNSAFAKKVVEYNKDAGITQTDIDDLLNNNVSKVGVDAEFFGRAINVVEMTNGINAALLQLHSLLGELGDTETQTTQWLEGTVPSGQNPAQQTAFMMQAGMQPIKSQARLMQMDGLYRFEWLMIWFYQTHLTAEMQIRIVGEYDENGMPRFITINQDVPREDLAAAAEQARAALDAGINAKIKIGKMYYEPAELLEQIEMIRERRDKDGTLPILRLNDISAARIDISVQDEGVLPYREQELKNVVLGLYDRQLATPETVLKTLKLPHSAADIAKLPITQQQQAMAVQQEQAQMAQAAAQQPPQQGAMPAAQMPPAGLQ